MNNDNKIKILIAGWFSFEDMGATAGDLLSCEVVSEWLSDAGFEFEVAFAPPFKGGVMWSKMDPKKYTHVIFVCGPFGNGWPVNEFLKHFSTARLIGLNLSMLDPIEQWNPFDLLYERDSDHRNLPDLTLLSHTQKVPVVGIILSHRQKEYGNRAKHSDINKLINQAVKLKEISVVKIDTSLVNNQYGLRTAGEVESLIAKMDLIITTRLHGMVLALKNEIPAIAIDPIDGGAKISKQAKVLDWPLLYTTDSVTLDNLIEAIDHAMTDYAKIKARECRKKGQKILMKLHKHFIRELNSLKKQIT